MILSAHQYRKLITDNVLKNKIKSVNAKLQNVTVAFKELQTLSDSFDVPSVVESVIHRDNITTDYGSVYCQEYRSEVKSFTFTTTIVFAEPVENMTVTFAPKYTTRMSAEGFWESGARSVYMPGNLNGIFKNVIKDNSSFDTGKWIMASDVPAAVDLTPAPTAHVYLYKIGESNASDFLIANTPAVYNKKFDWAQPDKYTLTIDVKYPFYNIIAVNTYPSYPPVSGQAQMQFTEALLTNYDIIIEGTTAIITEVAFNSGAQTPELEVPSNELMQFNATVSGEFIGSYMASKITNALAAGLQLISFELLDAEVALAVGDQIQIKDVFGNFVRNGMYFEVYSIGFTGVRKAVRTIKAKEVKNMQT